MEARRECWLKAGVFEHLQIPFGNFAARGQIIADENRVGHVESERLQGAKVIFAATGNTDFLARVHEPEQAEDSETFLWCKVFDAPQGSSRNRDQEVQRNRVHVHLAQRESKVHNLRVALAHAENAAGTRRNSGALDGLDGSHAVGIGVRGTDFAVMILRGIQVVVDALDAGVLEPLGFRVVEQAKAAANAQGILFLISRTAAMTWSSSRGVGRRPLITMQ